MDVHVNYIDCMNPLHAKYARNVRAYCDDELLENVWLVNLECGYLLQYASEEDDSDRIRIRTRELSDHPLDVRTHEELFSHRYHKYYVYDWKRVEGTVEVKEKG